MERQEFIFSVERREPKEADKDREIEMLKQWKKEAMEIMPDFQEIGKLLGIGLGESVSEQIIPKIKELKDKDIQSKWISVEAVKELLAKQRVLCAEYLEDSFSEHPYKLHQMINYAPEAEQK
jgi:hypothetical protein